MAMIWPNDGRPDLSVFSLEEQSQLNEVCLAIENFVKAAIEVSNSIAAGGNPNHRNRDG
jgi:hypothetical protein